MGKGQVFLFKALNQILIVRLHTSLHSAPNLQLELYRSVLLCEKRRFSHKKENFSLKLTV